MPLFTPSRALALVLVFAIVSFLWSSRLPQQYEQPPPLPVPEVYHEDTHSTVVSDPSVDDTGFETSNKSPSAQVGSEVDCTHVRGAKDIMLLIRTSKAELDGQDRLPRHLKTLLACVPSFAIFSDHSGTVADIPVHDALGSITNKTRAGHDEFLEYKKMQENKDYRPSRDRSEALDKWKFLPLVYKAATMNRKYKFYFLIDASTSLSWTNLLQWTDRLDYRIPYYNGAPAIHDEKKYAQKSPGILFSYASLQQYKRFFEQRYEAEWESHVSSECCGDIVLAKAMKESRVEFYPSSPLLQAEAPSTLQWTQKHWCTPAVSWHGMTSAERDSFWDLHAEWTQKNGWAKPYLYRNAFQQWILPHLKEKTDDWDNISSDTHIKADQGRREKLAQQKTAAGEKEKEKDKEKEKEKASKKRDSSDVADEVSATIQRAADSASNCQALCTKTDDCLQWKYTTKDDGECHLGRLLRLGKKVDRAGDAGEKWTSGWMLDRINKVTEGWGRCEKAEWTFNQ